MAETDYGRACSAAGGCTYSNLHCTYPECIWGRAVARSRTTDRRPIDPAVAELVEALRRSYDRLGDAADCINTLPRVADTLLEVNLRQERARIESLIAKHAASPRDAT